MVIFQGNENYVGVAARDTANALRVLTEATRSVASTSEDIKVRRQVIDSARDVIDKSTHLLEETKRAMNDPENPENQARLNQVAKAVSSALNSCVNALPRQRDVDNAIRQITDSSQELASTKVRRSVCSADKVYLRNRQNLSRKQIWSQNKWIKSQMASTEIVTSILEIDE